MRIQASRKETSKYYILTESQLPRLRSRTYMQQTTSILEPYAVSLCLKLLPLLPTWLAPNVLSLMSIALNVLVAVIFMWYCPTATEEVPAWMSVVLIGYTILNYILDTLDGAQARRLDQCSPLGEIMDHCTDVIKLYAMCLPFTFVLKLGSHPYLIFWLLFLCQWSSYTKHLSCFAHGGLVTEWVDMTETNLAGIIVATVVTIFGDSFLLYKLPSQVGGISVQALIGGLFTFHAAFVSVSKIYETIILPKERNKFYLSGNSIILSLLPMVFLTAGAIYVFEFSRFRASLSDLLLVSHTFAAVAVKLTWNVYVADIFQERVMLKEFCHVAPLALVIIDHFDLPVDAPLALMGCAIFVWVSNTVFFVQLCLDISQYLGINIFTITKKENKEQ